MNENENVVRFKTKLVAREFNQVYEIDYINIFASVAKLAFLRIFLIIAVTKNLEIHQMNVVTAFLISDFEEKIYMKQSKDFDTKKKLICKLQKKLYNLKQSARI